MRVSLRRTGGFAGRTIERSADTRDVPGLEALVNEARGSSAAAGDLPDAFRYEITVDGETITAGDGDALWMQVVERIL